MLFQFYCVGNLTLLSFPLPLQPLPLHNTAMPKNWHLNMPLSRKYLFVAAYLASKIPKEIDDAIFAGRKRKRRKVARKGTDPADDDEPASTEFGGGGSGPRPFSLDRLTSIFAQIASTGDVARLGGGARAALAFGRSNDHHTSNNTAKSNDENSANFTAMQIAENYGDADLFSTVSSCCCVLCAVCIQNEYDIVC
jgi:hypothetical protein